MDFNVGLFRFPSGVLPWSGGAVLVVLPLELPAVGGFLFVSLFALSAGLLVALLLGFVPVVS